VSNLYLFTPPPYSSLPFTGGETIFYWSVTINPNNNPFTLTTSDYASYSPLVNSSVFPAISEPITKTNGVSTIYFDNHITDATLSYGEVRCRIQCIDLPVVEFDTVVTAQIEAWNTVGGYIPISRQTYDYNITGFGNGLLGTYLNNFNLAGGNPADRTSLGVLQANGYFKSPVTINLPSISNANPITTATFYFNTIVRPVAVPPAANVQIPTLGT
jgi:hypothetical protein